MGPLLLKQKMLVDMNYHVSALFKISLTNIFPLQLTFIFLYLIDATKWAIFLLWSTVLRTPFSPNKTYILRWNLHWGSILLGIRFRWSSSSVYIQHYPKFQIRSFLHNVLTIRCPASPVWSKSSFPRCHPHWHSTPPNSLAGDTVTIR